MRNTLKCLIKLTTMKRLFESKTQKQAAKVSGLAIIIMAVAAVVANDVTIRSLIVTNNATETLSNILSSKIKFNIGILSWLIILICDLTVAWGLYLFFKNTNKNLSLLTAWFRLIYVGMLSISILNLVYCHLQINYIESYTIDITDQVAENFMFYLDAFDAMWALGLIVFGFHILLVGYLAIKSEHVPNIFGILLMAAFIGYTIPKISNFLFPGFKDIMSTVEAIFLIPMLGEVALGVWLFVIGFKGKHKIIN